MDPASRAANGHAPQNEVYRNIEHHLPDLLRYAQSLTRDKDAMQDLLQDSLLRALAKSSRYRPGSDLRAWLFAIMRNGFISDVRARARRGVQIDIEQVQAQLQAVSDPQARIRITEIEDALRALPEEQLVPLQAAALAGGSCADAAIACALPVGTVKSRISRARARLRARLDGPEAVHPVPETDVRRA